MKHNHLLIPLVCLFMCVPILRAQITKADYDRADALFNRYNMVYSGAVIPQWIGESSTFWYKNHERTGDYYYVVDAANGKKEKAFDNKKLAQLLSRETGKKMDAEKLPLAEVVFLSKTEITFKAEDARWKYNSKTNRLVKDENPVDNSDPRRGRWGGHRESGKVTSPDGKWDAFIRDDNVWIVAAGSEKDPVALTMDGSPNLYYSSRILWSPDSRKLATVKVREVEQRKIPLIESAPATQRQPILQWRTYPKPGDVLPSSAPVLIDVEQRKQIALDTELYTRDQFALYLGEWRKDSRGFTFDFNERGHQRYIVGEVDANTGTIRHLADEQTKTFIFYNKVYKYFLNDGEETLWASERDGWRHLYLLDGKTGAVKLQVTKGDWVMRDVVYVDEKNRTVYFTASGFNSGEDPYNVHYCRIGLDGTGFKDLTPENGHHQGTFSPDYAWFVDAYSRPDMPYTSVLRRTTDGQIIKELEKSDIDELLADGFTMPEVFHAKGRDGVTDIWGTITRPSNFNAAKSYPVIEMIYAGPHDSHVVKNFTAFNHLIGRVAELGFIVVSIDGMGTYNRSKAFHDVSWKNLKDAGYPDRILWIQAAAKKHAHMDISNVGIYGWSAGGQNSMAALLFFNDFYKVAVSLCGCHDNRMDKIWWNEQWMGYPLDESYSACSNVDNAHLLKGKLFLINGELDDNVDPTSTLQVVDALVKANKKFDQLYMPGHGHRLNSDWIWHRMYDFFVQNIKNEQSPE